MSNDAKNTESTQVATAQQFSQDNIPAMLKKINEKISQIKGDIGVETHTTKSLSEYGRIADIKTVGDLLKAFAAVDAREKAYANAASELLQDSGIKTPALKIDGHSPSAWKKDIKARIIVVGRKAELDKLNQAKKLLEENLSREAKLANDMAAITNMFTSDAEVE